MRVQFEPEFARNQGSRDKYPDLRIISLCALPHRLKEIFKICCLNISLLITQTEPDCSLVCSTKTLQAIFFQPNCEKGSNMNPTGKNGKTAITRTCKKIL